MSSDVVPNNKIGLMLITHDLDLGGLQQVVYNICRTIDRERFDIHVLCLRNLGCFANDVRALDIPVYLLEKKTVGTDYFAFLKIVPLLRRLNISVIHTHNTQPFLDGTVAALLAGVKTIVHTDHARAFPDKFRYMFAEWMVSQFAYRVVGCSTHSSEQLIKYEKIARRKVVTIPNGIDALRFTEQFDVEAMRAEIGLAPNCFAIGYAGRLSEEKGVNFLVAALPAVLSVFPNTTLLIIGDGDELAALKAQAADLGVERQILFLGTRKDIPALLRLLTVFALPSKREGLPMVLLEAMASRCPVVASNVGGIPTVIVDGESGCLVQSENSAALAAGLIELLTSSERRHAYSDRAYAVFEESYGAKSMTQKYEALYLRQAAQELRD